MTPQLQPVQFPVPAWLNGSLGITLLDPQGTYRLCDGRTGDTVFESNPGPQTWSLLCPYDEILIGGRRGGGKSRCLTAWMATGDLTLPENDPARATFLNDKSFRGLFLREEYQSMVEFIEEAVEFFKAFGGKASGGGSKPVEINFDSGAKIYFNHLASEEAFNKYKGWNLTRIGIEELTQISTLKRFLKLKGSLRSVERIRGKLRLPPLRTQMMGTTNPDGPGAAWIKDRFVEVRGKDGKLIPWNTGMRDTFTGGTRIFIPFGLEANPYLAEDTAAGRAYRANLLAQDEVTRKQWMEGDWNAGTGKFFKEYRPEGPIGQEEADKYPWARHIIPAGSVKLEPWWYRWGSCDPGYDHPSAHHKYCRNERDKRIHVYDEMQVRNVGYFEQGALLAKWWHPDLIAAQRAGADPCVTIYMGADAFSRTDATKTKAEQMAAGIQEVLGPYGALLLKYNEEEKEAQRRDPKRAQMLFEMRKRELQGHICIALKPVYFDRIAAWGYVRDWLRFRPAVLPLQTEEDRAKFLQDVLEREGVAAYEMQAAAMRELKPEILPKVQIWDVCRELDRCLRTAQHDTRGDDDPAKTSKREDVLKFNADENGLNGDDALDSFRDGAVAYKEIETVIPREYWVADRVEQAQQQHVQDFGAPLTDPTRLAMIAQRQATLYEKTNRQPGGTWTPPRASVRVQ